MTSEEGGVCDLPEVGVVGVKDACEPQEDVEEEEVVMKDRVSEENQKE